MPRYDPPAENAIRVRFEAVLSENGDNPGVVQFRHYQVSKKPLSSRKGLFPTLDTQYLGRPNYPPELHWLASYAVDLAYWPPSWAGSDRDSFWPALGQLLPVSMRTIANYQSNLLDGSQTCHQPLAGWWRSDSRSKRRCQAAEVPDQN